MECLTKPHGKTTVSSFGTHVGADMTLFQAPGPAPPAGRRGGLTELLELAAIHRGLQDVLLEV